MRRSLLFPILLLAASLAAQTRVPAAVTTDLPPDKSNPPSMEELAIPSHGSTMNGLIYVAAGAGPHPVVILLHGFPGYEQNLDLAQSIRRAGWDVVFFHYRGSWGSQGSFTFANCIEDVHVALNWVRNPDNAKKFHMDPKTIVLVGHSMGGFMAPAAAAADPGVSGIVMIAGWNIGDTAKKPDVLTKMKDDFAQEMGPLSGCTVDGLIAEIKQHGDKWDFDTFAPALKDRPVLVMTTNDGLASADDAFVASLKAVGSTRVQFQHLESDHGFSGQRIALQAAIVNWLEQFGR